MMDIIKRVLLPCVIFFQYSLNCFANATEDFFPLIDNASQSYQINSGPGQETISVLPGTSTINSVATKRVFYDSDDTTEFYTNDTAGLFIHGSSFPDPDLGTITVTISPAIKVLNAQLNVGDSFTNNSNASYTVPGFGTFPLNYSVSTTVESEENVTVPIGSFNAIKVINTQTLSGNILGTPISETSQLRFWYVEHLGPVKIEDITENDLFESIAVDSDGDGTINSVDTDDDNDGVNDIDDAFPLDPDRSTSINIPIPIWAIICLIGIVLLSLPYLNNSKLFIKYK